MQINSKAYDREILDRIVIPDRKSTRLNSSHPSISYAVFCLKKNNKTVKIFPKGERIGSHARSPNRRGHTTIADHIPSFFFNYGKSTQICPLSPRDNLRL